MMRVIAGTARGKNLAALPGEDVTRPTINRVKEAMFSSVQFSVPGARVLDLFAGSGQLGIEALSRGAKRCVFLDASREAIQIVLANCKTAGVFAQSRVIPDDAFHFLATTQEEFDRTWPLAVWCCVKQNWTPSCRNRLRGLFWQNNISTARFW